MAKCMESEDLDTFSRKRMSHLFLGYGQVVDNEVKWKNDFFRSMLCTHTCSVAGTKEASENGSQS